MLAALMGDRYSIDLTRQRSILEILRSALDLYRRYPRSSVVS
jgi:hypothetical protein